MLAMLEKGLDVSPVITHHFDVTEYDEAFEAVRSGNSGKVILEWS
jgi:threonine 3-dehydrogenase